MPIEIHAVYDYACEFLSTIILISQMCTPNSMPLLAYKVPLLRNMMDPLLSPLAKEQLVVVNPWGGRVDTSEMAPQLPFTTLILTRQLVCGFNPLIMPFPLGFAWTFLKTSCPFDFIPTPNSISYDSFWQGRCRNWQWIQVEEERSFMGRGRRGSSWIWDSRCGVWFQKTEDERRMCEVEVVDSIGWRGFVVGQQVVGWGEAEEGYHFLELAARDRIYFQTDQVLVILNWKLSNYNVLRTILLSKYSNPIILSDILSTNLAQSSYSLLATSTSLSVLSYAVWHSSQYF